jgi:phosphopantothenoylcysteine decarboxylase / phosphopantothenate---cysteine ligase
VANDVSVKGIGFDAEDNQVTLLDRWGGAADLPRMSKLEVADAILDRVVALRAADRSPSPDRAAH